MLHVRLVSSPGSTDHLVERLSADPGVRNLVVMRGAARCPDGDAVQFDLLTRFANPVLRELRAQVQDYGPVVIQNVDAAINGPGEPGDHGRQRYGEIPPVWEMVESKIRAGGEYPLSFYALLIIAGLIGAVGILTNSQILIVAAMVVGPEYGAIMATALGIDQGDRRAVRHGLAALAAGFAIAVLATFLFGLLIRWSGETP
ncbi:MAG: putative integral rane protein, partial [Actinomycetia bacterium]|nr:putative integral rane protein [Actinomycetes bacterium]